MKNDTVLISNSNRKGHPHKDNTSTDSLILFRIYYSSQAVDALNKLVEITRMRHKAPKTYIEKVNLNATLVILCKLKKFVLAH